MPYPVLVISLAHNRDPLVNLTQYTPKLATLDLCNDPPLVPGHGKR
jgi:hypothetical protein